MPRGIYKRKTIKRPCWIENHVCHIPLQNGQVAICDETEFEKVSKCNWYLSAKSGKYVRTSNPDNRKIKKSLHNFLYPEFKMLDHINRNKLDNRSCNLRECTNQQNQANRPHQKNNSSGFKGVSFNKNKIYEAKIMFFKKRIHIGYFNDPEEAARAYDAKAREFFGDFALCNFR